MPIPLRLCSRPVSDDGVDGSHETAEPNEKRIPVSRNRSVVLLTALRFCQLAYSTLAYYSLAGFGFGGPSGNLDFRRHGPSNHWPDPAHHSAPTMRTMRWLRIQVRPGDEWQLWGPSTYISAGLRSPDLPGRRSCRAVPAASDLQDQEKTPTRLGHSLWGWVCRYGRAEYHDAPGYSLRGALPWPLSNKPYAAIRPNMPFDFRGCVANIFQLWKHTVC